MLQNFANNLFNPSGLDSLELLNELVGIDSQVKNIQGIERVQKYCANILSHLGFQVEFITNKLYHSAPLLLAKKAGTIGHQTVTFIGHSDVVTSSHKIPFQLKQDKIFGSGVADDKGGLTVLLTALRKFLEKNFSHHFDLQVVISPNEETGSLGFHDLFATIGKESTYVLGLEPALSCGSLIHARSGNRWYQVKIKGIEAHAGRFGDDHINAAHKLGRVIGELSFLTDESLKRRVNIGSIRGGNGGFNTICGEAEAKIDMRFSTFECRDMLHYRFENILKNNFLRCPYSHKQSEVYYSIEDDCPPLSLKNNKAFDFLYEVISQLENKKIIGQHAGGAADINYFANRENYLIDGLGPIGGGMHTKNEYILKDSLFTRSYALTQFLEKNNVAKWFTRSEQCQSVSSMN